MEVLSQAPQPTIKCYHSLKEGNRASLLYQEFTPTSNNKAGKNLQSYTFSDSLENFGGEFSFTVKEDIPNNDISRTFMDSVEPLDIIEISESGSEQKIDFIGVVTKVSVGGIASNLNKTVTVSGKSIEWLFTYYNINTDLKACLFQNDAANKAFLADLATDDGKKAASIKYIVTKSFEMFDKYANINSEISNTAISKIIKKWYGESYDEFIVASDAKFLYPISSNLFESGRINVIDYIKKLLPSPVYEIFGFIDDFGKPKLKIRLVPFDNPEASYTIKPVQLTDFTLTRSCEEVYTAFMPYIEGSSQSASFYMNLQATNKGYDAAKANSEKVNVYGYQLLTCSFAGYNTNPKSGQVNSVSHNDLQKLADNLDRWFSHLDDMYSGDFTLVNVIDDSVRSRNKAARIGEWVSFAKGLFYVFSETHSWNYGDNPMINYQVGRGGKYFNGQMIRITNLSEIYREFD